MDLDPHRNARDLCTCGHLKTNHWHRCAASRKSYRHCLRCECILYTSKSDGRNRPVSKVKR